MGTQALPWEACLRWKTMKEPQTPEAVKLVGRCRSLGVLGLDARAGLRRQKPPMCSGAVHSGDSWTVILQRAGVDTCAGLCEGPYWGHLSFSSPTGAWPWLPKIQVLSSDHPDSASPPPLLPHLLSRFPRSFFILLSEPRRGGLCLGAGLYPQWGPCFAAL